eukprot:gene4889-34652_t
MLNDAGATGSKLRNAQHRCLVRPNSASNRDARVPLAPQIGSQSKSVQYQPVIVITPSSNLLSSLPLAGTGEPGAMGKGGALLCSDGSSKMLRLTSMLRAQAGDTKRTIDPEAKYVERTKLLESMRKKENAN